MLNISTDRFKVKRCAGEHTVTVTCRDGTTHTLSRRDLPSVSAMALMSEQQFDRMLQKLTRST